MWKNDQLVDPRRGHSWQARGAAVWTRRSSRIRGKTMGAWLAVSPRRTIKSSYTCVLLFTLFSIISVDSSVSPDVHATHRGLVPIVITSKTNGYVGRSGPESRWCLCYRCVS